MFVTEEPICPDAIQTSKPSRNDDVIVSWVEPNVTDELGIIPIVSKSHTPGSAFQVGSTIVTYSFGRFDDDSTVSCSFTVTVTEGKCKKLYKKIQNYSS